MYNIFRKGKIMSSSRQLINKLKKAGWTLDRITGDHHIFKKPGFPNIVVVPHPRKDVATGTEHKILKQAGIK